MWSTMTKEETRRKLRTDYIQGLRSEEAKKRLEQYGENKIEQKKKTSLIVRFLQQFNDFMIIILLLAAGISAIMEYAEGTRRIHRLYHNNRNSSIQRMHGTNSRK